VGLVVGRLLGEEEEVSSCLFLFHVETLQRVKQRLMYCPFDMNRIAAIRACAYYRTCRDFGKHTM
jgi:hypothetical protein